MIDPAPIERHLAAGGVPALSFSGGKDSTACLTLLKPWWDRLVVVWVNTGDAFPETLEIMTRVREQVGRFAEIKSDQPAQVAAHGWPSEVVPTTLTPLGRLLDGHERPLVQPYFGCCGTNIWLPLARAMRDLGATLIIRGQKMVDVRKAPLSSGDQADGIEYWFPIEGWTDEEVFAYLNTEGVEIPVHYRHTETSLDCRHCTAYLYENVRKMAWLRSAHPALAAELRRRLRVIRGAVVDELHHIDRAIGG